MIDFPWRISDVPRVGALDWDAIQWYAQAFDEEALPNSKSKEIIDSGWVIIGLTADDVEFGHEFAEQIYIACKSKRIYPVILTCSDFSLFRSFGFQVEYCPKANHSENYRHQLESLWQMSAVLPLRQFLEVAGRIPSGENLTLGALV